MIFFKEVQVKGDGGNKILEVALVQHAIVSNTKRYCRCNKTLHRTKLIWNDIYLEENKLWIDKQSHNLVKACSVIWENLEFFKSKDYIIKLDLSNYSGIQAPTRT